MTQFTAICRTYIDLMVQVTDEEFSKHNLTPGDIVFTPEKDLAALFDTYHERGIVMAGGPAANTMAILASMNEPSTFIGKTARDKQAAIFTEGFDNLCVSFSPIPSEIGMTASCIIFVLPNGERTIVFNDGISNILTEEDIQTNIDALKHTKYLYLGLVYYKDVSDEIIKKIIEITPQDCQIITTLQNYTRPDPDLGRKLLGGDIILGNIHEYSILCSDLGYTDMANLSAAFPEKIFACTKSEQGANIYHNETVACIKAQEPATIIDATGAGDAWAAGFLYGLANGLSLQESGDLGAAKACEILKHLGARLPHK